MRHPDRLDADDTATLAAIRSTCPHLDALAAHVTGCAEMMTGRHGERLSAWIAGVVADDEP